MKNVFCNVEERQRICILLIDEVYVKPVLMYHGGTIFGKAINKPNELANTVLGYYIVTFGGPIFLLRMLPVSGLNAPFQFDETQKIIECVKDAGGSILLFCIISLVRVNQAFFASFDRVKPWLTKQGIYLLFDFVCIIKSI